jgi:hypothetical protein
MILGYKKCKQMSSVKLYSHKDEANHIPIYFILLMIPSLNLSIGSSSILFTVVINKVSPAAGSLACLSKTKIVKVDDKTS